MDSGFGIRGNADIQIQCPEAAFNADLQARGFLGESTCNQIQNFVTSPDNNADAVSNGCKHCNCKKTKCLKLYCKCFAARSYCSDSCACKACFNKPEHNDSVLGATQEALSRNPEAFASTIIKPPATSARHRKGCNCKKSKCSQRYCECYKASVGCCGSCPCRGCENVHGRNEVHHGEPSHRHHHHQQQQQLSIPSSNQGETAQNSGVPLIQPSSESSVANYYHPLNQPNTNFLCVIGLFFQIHKFVYMNQIGSGNLYTNLCRLVKEGVVVCTHICVD